MKKIYPAIRWVASNAAIAFALYLGLTGKKWAWNLFAFLQWYSAIIWALAYSARNESKFFQDWRPRSVPEWLDASYDFAIALALAASGHFIYATLRIIELMFSGAFYKARQSQKAEAKN